jgi:glycosyltransferase involved in cell wall biosynthesis
MISDRHLEGTVMVSAPVNNPMALLNAHHVLCMASTDEPFGRVAAEAMGCGLPVIGFATGGLTEVVASGETGILVSDGDVDGLARAMVSFVADPGSIIAMGKAGRLRAELLFNREKQVPLITRFILERAKECRL